MEICKNKKTGQAFVFLEEHHNGKSLMITPQCTVKVLEYYLFSEPVEVEEEEGLVAQGKINRFQYDIYHQYIKDQEISHKV